MVFCSDRENRTNLFRYDLDTRVITQMTDLDGRQRLIGCVSEAKNEVYFWTKTQLLAVALDTYVQRTIVEVDPRMPPSLIKSRAAPTADGKYLCAQLMENPPQEQASISFSYSRFREYYEKRPLSQIVRIEIESGAQEVIHEDRRYLGHVNTSPTQPDLLTFCHEGPWNLVEQRIWELNIQTGEMWKVRPQDGDYSIGHEYWFADGVHIGRSDRRLPRAAEGRNPRVLCGGAARVWAHPLGQRRVGRGPFPLPRAKLGKRFALPAHFHSLDETLIVGDGTAAFAFTSESPARPYIQLFKRDGERYVGPKILAYHVGKAANCSVFPRTFNNQHAHCRARSVRRALRRMARRCCIGRI